MEERLIALLRLAIKYNATDIHFSKKYNEISIDIRIDGSLKKVKTKPEDLRIIKYLQYLASLDIGKLLEPQTGQFEMEVDNNILSLRFAIINDVETSNGVLRILNSSIKIDANHLSEIKEQNEYLKELLNEDYGLIIFSGPTGSGKTTTLYSLLKSVTNKKIYTIEDPIEVYNDNFVQIEINETVGLDYETGIKQVLRHDPDIIMIGEIRDAKAAKMAVVAANTGHLVLTTIHASTASSVISRMSELGVDERHLYEMLLCISNQRMLIGDNHKKIVVYELMDKEEIKYFKEHDANSKAFLTITKQLEEGRKNGIFK